MLLISSGENTQSFARRCIRSFGLGYIFLTGMAIAINGELGEKLLEATIIAWLPLLFIKPTRKLSSAECWWMAVTGLTVLSAWISYCFHADLDRAKSMTEVYSKYLLPVFYLFMLRRIDFKLTQLKFFFILVALCAGATALYESVSIADSIEDRGFITHGRPILFGGIALISGWLSILLINPANKWYLIIFSLMAFAAGVYTAFFSESRGVWIAFPLLLILPAVLIANKKQYLKNYAIPLTAAVIVGIIWVSQFTEVFEERIDLVISDIKSYQTDSQTGAQTSTGARLEMWKATIILFKEHPFWGVGIGDVPLHFKELAEQGLVSESLVKAHFTHMHNEFFHVLATRGMIGLSTLLTMIIWLIVFFKKNLVANRIADKASKNMATLCQAGFALLAACVIYSLTDSYFSSNIGAGYFLLSMTLIIKILVDLQITTSAEKPAI